MQNDERDERDLPPDDPSQPPPPDVGDEAESADAETDEAADEFETASWPSHDRAPSQHDTTQPPEEPDGADTFATDEVAAPMPPMAEPDDEVLAAESGPPPPEVEAYEGSADAAATEAGAVVAAHSVPATTEPGESTRCPRCGTENRPGIAFCQNCGQRLIAAGAPATVERPAAPDGTQACPRCGTHNRAGVAFCQNCGANLQAAEPGAEPGADVTPEEPVAAGHALLGPVVLLVGAIGIATAWLLPFALGNTSLYDRAFGDPSGYGIAFWTAYDGISGLAAQAYFGFAAPAPILVLLLVALAIGGVVRARPATLQAIGLIAALVWSLGLATLFVVVEVLGGAGGDLLQMLAGLSPGGIIFALASLIVVIGCLTRLGRG